MPAASAPAMSAVGLSPTIQTFSGDPASASAAANGEVPANSTGSDPLAWNSRDGRDQRGPAHPACHWQSSGATVQMFTMP